MKNLLLTVLIFFSFCIVLFFEGAPQRGEFVVEVNTTLRQLSEDLPALTKRIEHGEKRSVVDSLFANTLAHSILVSNDCSTRPIAASEPDCGGWND